MLQREQRSKFVNNTLIEPLGANMMKIMLLGISVVLSIGVGSAWANENEGAGSAVANPQTELLRSDLATPGVAVLAPMQNAPPVAAIVQDRRLVLLY
jgi:hypothetical protein